MHSLKKIIHEIADQLPEQATFDDAMYALYVRQKIESGLRDIEQGRVLDHEQVRERLLSRGNKQ